MDRVKGKVALITGASSGIGLESAKRLLDEGAIVYITGRRLAPLQEAVTLTDGRMRYIQADCSKKADMEITAEQIRQECGRLDIVFANAGVGKYIKLEDITEADLDWTLGINIKGTFFTVQSVLPILSEGASIILNTSITEDMGLPDFSLYAASKAAVSSLVHSWTTDLKARHIRVNAISPGVIPTSAGTGELGRSEEEEIAKQKWRTSLTPLGRMGNVSDIADTVVFLASAESSFITGIELKVDGGISAAFVNRM